MVTISCLATNILLNVNLESRSPTSFPRGMIGLKIAALWNVKMFLHSRLLVWPRYSQHLVICSVADGVWDNYGIKTEGVILKGTIKGNGHVPCISYKKKKLRNSKSSNPKYIRENINKIYITNLYILTYKYIKMCLVLANVRIAIFIIISWVRDLRKSSTLSIKLITHITLFALQT